MAAKWTEADIPDQHGRVAIITGANSGIGFIEARALAARGATVVLACRTPARGEAARASILAGVPQADVRVAQLDTADLASVRRFADEMAQALPRLDLLINNAGVMAIPRQRSVDGFDLQLATNHLGHFALTGLLLPLLEMAPHSRVVTVSSLAANRGRIHFDDLQFEREYDPWTAYYQSKLANLVFALELHRRLQRNGSRVQSLAAHPGISRTNLFYSDGRSWMKQLPPKLFGWLLQPAEQGALPVLHAATAPTARGGEYYGPSQFFEVRGWPAPAAVVTAARDEDTGRRLWTVSEQLTGVSYP